MGEYDSGEKGVVFGVLLIAVLSSMPLFTNYLLSSSDDMSFHLMRIEGLAQGLREEIFPVRMQQLWLNGHGYPVSIMYGDFLLYVPALLRLVGFPLQTVFKIYVFMINLATACIAYRCGKRVSGDYKIGLVVSMLYTFSVYRLINLYYRSALGEYTGMAFLPLVFLGLWQLFESSSKEERRHSLMILLASYTLILESHLLSFLMAVVFSGLYCLLNWKAFVKNIVSLVQTGVVTVFLNSWFLVPLIDYLRNQPMNPIDSDRFHMQEWGLLIPQLFQMNSTSTENIGYFPAGDGILQERLMGVGMPFALIILLFLRGVFVHGIAYRSACSKKGWKSQVRMFVLMMLSVWMTCCFFPWLKIEGTPRIGSLLAPYQFAWRFTQMALTFGLFFGAYVLKSSSSFLGKNRCEIVLMLLCAVAVITGLGCVEARLAGSVPLRITSAGGMDTRSAIANGEYLPGETYSQLINADGPEAEEGCEIINYERFGNTMRVSYSNPMEKEAYIKVPFLSYRGYRVIDEQTKYGYNVTLDYQNVIMVIVPPNYAGTFLVYSEVPRSWHYAEAVTLLTLIGLAAGWIICKRAKGKIL